MRLTHNTLSENVRSQSIGSLNKHLVAAIDLHAQVKQAHWNVRGPGFIALHELFDKVPERVKAFADQLAERVGSLGGAAQGTIQVAAEADVPRSLQTRHRRRAAALHRGGRVPRRVRSVGPGGDRRSRRHR